MDSSENGLTVQHLWNIGQQLATSCSAASRYYMFNLKRYLISEPTLESKEIKSHKFCKHCGSLWSSENHRVRIQPAPSKNSHIKKLLKWEAETPWKLNNHQKKKLKKFKEATSKIIYSCFSCKKTVKVSGFKRKTQNVSKRTSLYTLPPNIKRNKSDLNAGLFISEAAPTQKKNKRNSQKKSNCEMLHSVSDTRDMIEVTDKSSNSTSEMLSRSAHSKRNFAQIKHPPNLVNESSISKISNNKKKKKSLLAQILQQEQNSQKKKSSLSSFLVSI